MSTEWLTRTEAAEYLSLSTKTLANLAWSSSGPPFHKPGGKLTYYDVHELDEWVNSNGASAKRRRKR